MSDGPIGQIGPDDSKLGPGLPGHPTARRTLLPEGYEITIDGRKFRLEMRTVISGTSEDIAAVKLKQLE